ncbi:MAG: B12-binding domain-containing radical SAM protein [Candidatus Bathyarchaeota archaeon]|nr:B12-binding domain-containing radical SAM protein [Candidatus Bathyarchaeota archaeon]
MTAKVALIYPYFHPANDNSVFRFPPLGLGYIAAALKKQGAEVELVDCTFMHFREAVERIKRAKPQIVGFYSMFSMKKTTLELAHALRDEGLGGCLFVVGGPLPSWAPEGFLDVFDVVAVGEGEQTMIELVECVGQGKELSGVKGLVFKDGKQIIKTEPRKFIEDLDTLSFPTRDLFDNDAYKKYYLNRFGYSTTSMITSRGCPFSCDFCSRPIFGADMRTRSVTNIVDEVEEIAGLGYDRVWFADDCFTLNRKHLLDVCGEMVRRGVDIGWECLSRVDTMDTEVAEGMKRAGCIGVFFGIESGNDSVLSLMNKHITISQAERAVYAAKAAGLKVGAFFIVGYPGESNKTVLDTVRFASGLPLDYLSFTLPYPIPGTPLYERVKDNGVSIEDWEEPKNYRLIRHKLLYASGFSEAKLKFAIGKAQAQFYGRKYLGKMGYGVLGRPFERLTNFAFERMR